MDQPNNSQEAIIKEIEKFKKRLFWSNIVEIQAGIIVIIVFSVFAFKFRNGIIFLPIGSLLIAAGVVFVILYIIKNRMRKGIMPSKEDKIEYLSNDLEELKDKVDKMERLLKKKLDSAEPE